MSWGRTLQLGRTPKRDAFMREYCPKRQAEIGAERGHGDNPGMASVGSTVTSQYRGAAGSGSGVRPGGARENPTCSLDTAPATAVERLQTEFRVGRNGVGGGGGRPDGVVGGTTWRVDRDVRRLQTRA